MLPLSFWHDTFDILNTFLENLSKPFEVLSSKAMHISSLRQWTSLTLYGILNPRGYDAFVTPPQGSLKNPRPVIANEQIAKGNSITS